MSTPFNLLRGIADLTACLTIAQFRRWSYYPGKPQGMNASDSVEAVRSFAMAAGPLLSVGLRISPKPDGGRLLGTRYSGVASMSLGLRLLGQLEVVRNGKALPLPPSKKTRALLAYLVATHRPHSRAELCELFWEDPDDPRAALRWSLTKIRQLL